MNEYRTGAVMPTITRKAIWLVESEVGTHYHLIYGAYLDRNLALAVKEYLNQEPGEQWVVSGSIDVDRIPDQAKEVSR